MEGILLAIVLIVVIVFPFKESVMNGLYSTYSKKGVVLSERHYKEGKLDGVYKTYYEDGKIMSEFTDLEGNRQGVANLYYKSGNLQSKITYTDGVMDGVKNIYFDEKENKIQFIDTYKNGQAINRKEYEQSGKLIDNKSFKFTDSNKPIGIPRH